MNRARIVDAVVLLLRLIVGGIFVFAGVSKMGNPTLFAAEIAGFRILPSVVIAPLALVLVGLFLIRRRIRMKASS